MNTNTSRLCAEITEAPKELIDELVSEFSDPGLAMKWITDMREFIETEMIPIENRDGAYLMLALMERLVEEHGTTHSPLHASQMITLSLCAVVICPLLDRMQLVDDLHSQKEKLGEAAETIRREMRRYRSKSKRLENRNKDIDSAARTLNELRNTSSRSVTLKQVAAKLVKDKTQMALKSETSWIDRLRRLTKTEIEVRADIVLRN